MAERRAAVRPSRAFQLCMVGVIAGLATLTLATWSQSVQSSAHFPSPTQIKELLFQGQFDELEQVLNQSQADFEAGSRSEGEVSDLFSAFATSDTAFAEALDNWNESFPDSAVAPLARAQYNSHRGWVVRGARFVGDTAEARLALMNELFEQAQADAVRAIQRNKKQSLAYDTLIDIGNARGAPWTERVMLKGLEALPSSYSIRWAYLYSLTPWWGGSPDEIRAFIDAHVRPAANQDDLQSLYGFPDYVTGETWRRRGREAEALQYYDRALKHGDNKTYLRERAKAYKSLKRYEEALADYNRMLELSPNWADTLDDRAALYFWSLKDREAAYADWERAIALEPLDPDMRFRRASALYQAKRYEEANSDLEAALAFGSGDHRIQELRGRNLIYNLKRYRPGSEAMKVATELEPDNANYWYHYAYALDRLLDCDTVPAFERYIEICEVTQTCGPEYLDYARKVSVFLVKKGKCPRQ